ncbi:MAG: SPOR domain-containing protein [Cyclobacteriaceae bacterium]|nr:SPOR domain-containing protein [Cyclobacteriaceae bacterium]
MRINYRELEVRSQKSELRFCQPNFYILTSILLFLFAISCQAQRPTKPYYEDLSSLRPKVNIETISPKDSLRMKSQTPSVPIQFSVNKKVDTILDSIDRFNITRKFVDGYTIQIYSGQKKEDALNTKTKMSEFVPHLKANVQYQQPKFKVTVGKYFTRLEAQKDLYRLKRVFTNAILVPERIMIK